jgi:hypothetical protein
MTRLFLFTIYVSRNTFLLYHNILVHVTLVHIAHISSRHTLVYVIHYFTSHTTSRYIYIITMDSLLGQEFETMAKARDAIKETIIDAGLSYKTLKLRLICYILVCEDNICNNFFFIILYFLLVLTKNRPFLTAYFIFTTPWYSSNYYIHTVYLFYYYTH